MTIKKKTTKTVEKTAAPVRARKAKTETKHPISKFTTENFYEELIKTVSPSILTKLSEYIVAYPTSYSKGGVKSNSFVTLLNQFLWSATPEGQIYWLNFDMNASKNLRPLSYLNYIQFASSKKESEKDAFNVSNLEANSIEINVPGYVLDTENSTPEKIVLKAVTTAVEEPKKPAFPKSWEELERINGWFVTNECKLSSIAGMLPTPDAKNTFVTKEQAEASLALAQLSQLREVYRQGWVPDWSVNHDKHCIRFYENTPTIDLLDHSNHFLSFQTLEIAEKFLENFKDLIKKALPLMS